MSRLGVESAVAAVWLGAPVRRFNLQAGRWRPNLRGMFDTIKAELATATDKLAHLRRFL